MKTKTFEDNPILCPLVQAPTVPLCDLIELNGLASFIEKNEKIPNDIQFERGNISKDGRLDLCKQGLGLSGTEKIVNAIRKNSLIKHILLGTDSLGNEGAEILASHIEHNDTLETIYLGCNLITEQGIKTLSSALAHNTQVKSLWLKRNPIGNTGAMYLSEMLKSNLSLRTLDLVNTKIGPKGLAFIADALENSNTSLQAIYLGGNQLDSSAIDSLIKILHTPNLKALFLNVNHLGDSFIGALIHNPPANNEALTLGIGSNGLTEKSLKTLLNNTTIKFRSLDLGYPRSTKALGAKANFFGDRFGKPWRDWISNQNQLESLILNRTGVGQNSFIAMQDKIEEHPTLHTLKLNRFKNSALRAKLHKIHRQREITATDFKDYRDDVLKIKSIYR